jgi:hypothetical protein
MRTLTIRHGPEELAARLEQSPSQRGLILSPFALPEISEAAGCADNGERLKAFPSLPIDRATIL